MYKNYITKPISNHEFAVTKNYIFCGLIVLFSFTITYYGLIYYGSEWYLTYNRKIYSFYFNWEIYIPYIPSFYTIYYSILILPFLTPLIIKKRIELEKLTLKLTIAILISGIIFYLFPSKLGYVDDLVTNNKIENLTRKLIGRNNPFPSLHVLLLQIFIYSFMNTVVNKYKIISTGYFFLVIFSTLFTHQHHILDILCALAIGSCLDYFSRDNKHI